MHLTPFSLGLPIGPSHVSVPSVCPSHSRHQTELSIHSRREYQHVNPGSSLRARWMSLKLPRLIRSRLNTTKDTGH